MKESTLQIQCVEYLTILAQKHPDLVFFSIPNEGIMFSMRQFGVNKEAIAKITTHFKKMGMLAGVADFCILFKCNVFFIEFKAPGKEPNERQKRIHQKILASGFNVYIYDNFEAFKNFIDGKIYSLKDVNMLIKR